MSYPRDHGTATYPKGQTVKCEHCGTEVRVPPNQIVATCPNRECGARVTVPNQTYQRGPRP